MTIVEKIKAIKSARTSTHDWIEYAMSQPDFDKMEISCSEEEYLEYCKGIDISEMYFNDKELWT